MKNYIQFINTIFTLATKHIVYLSPTIARTILMTIFFTTSFAGAETNSSSIKLPQSTNKWQLKPRLISSRYKYEEPTLMSIKGQLTGISIDSRYNFNNHYFVNLQGEYLSGDTDYQGRYLYRSELTPLIPNKDTNTNYGLTFGRHFEIIPNKNSFEFSFGYARWKIYNENDSRDREQYYHYLPIITAFEHRLSLQTKIIMSVQYDYFLAGKNVTHWEQVNSRLESQTYRQKEGSGSKISFEIARNFADYQLIAGAFLRKWNIEDSEPSQLMFKNGVLATRNGRRMSLIEPHNNTEMFGLSIGANF